MQAIAIIAASGVGKRMKLPSGKTKQYLKLGVYPVIYYALSAFQQASSVETIFVATLKSHISYLQKMARRYGFDKVQFVIEGGKERQDSIFNCVEKIREVYGKDGALEDKVILIHDGVRPFIQPHEIDEVAARSKEFGACVPATKPKDTIKYIAGDDNRFFGETLDRSQLLQVQTPQGFRADVIMSAHEKAQHDDFYATDDAALTEAYFPEQKINIFEMGYHNIKITTPEDMDLGKAILKRLRQSK